MAAGLPLAVVLALAGAFTALSTGHKPAQAGILIALAETPSQLAAANAVWSGVDNAGFLPGPSRPAPGQPDRARAPARHPFGHA